MHPCVRLEYAAEFRRIIKSCGPYDVIHSHVHHYSGFVLKVAHSAGVPVRIAHSHSDTTMLQHQANSLRRVYLQLMQFLIGRYATLGLAVSEKAACALWGAKWRSDPRWRILHHGIDVRPFEIEP